MNFLCECIDDEITGEEAFHLVTGWHCFLCFTFITRGGWIPNMELVDDLGLTVVELERPLPRGEEE